MRMAISRGIFSDSLYVFWISMAFWAASSIILRAFSNSLRDWVMLKKWFAASIYLSSPLMKFLLLYILSKFR